MRTPPHPMFLSIFTFLSHYLAFVKYTRLDRVLFEGNEEARNA